MIPDRHSYHDEHAAAGRLFRFVVGAYPAITKTEVEAAMPRLPDNEHKKMNSQNTRSYEKQFEVPAPVEAVWNAITQGEELTRWFCQEASCAPGVGGEQHIDWGGGVTVTQVITIWKPNEHLRTEAVRPDLAKMTSGEPYATDWYFTHQGGVTRIRMVASGFGDGPEWDHEYDGTFHGWDLFHKTLKHYLEHHRGHFSNNVVIYAMLEASPEDAWARLMSAEGFVREGTLGNLSDGASFQFTTSRGDRFAGTVGHYVPTKVFAAVIDNWNKAILRIEIAPVPGHGHFLYLSLSSWGLPKADVDALGHRLKAIVHELFPQNSEIPYPVCS
jgi:uncharacterized protein YndB with AHSA1/START domain